MVCERPGSPHLSEGDWWVEFLPLGLPVWGLQRVKPGATTVDLPNTDAGSSGLWQYLRDFRVTGAEAVSEDGPSRRIIRSVSGAHLAISYRVVSAFDHDPRVQDLDTYKPAVRPRWFWAYGEALFARPEGYVRAHFTWSAPPALPFASSIQGPPD